MGRIANRLALKMHPLHPQASLLARVAADYARLQDDENREELAGLLETGLRELQPLEFEELLGLARKLVEPRRDAPEVDGALVDVTTRVRERVQDSGAGSGTLAAIPVMVTGDRPAHLVGLCDMQCEALGDLLKQRDLVAGDSRVEFLPRLLSPQEADRMLDGEVFRVARALAEGDADAAVEALRASGERTCPAAAVSSVLQQRTSFGVLVVFVRCMDTEMFPLAAMVRHELKDEQCPPESPSSENEDVFADVRDVLDGVSRQLADILGVDAAAFIEPADAWVETCDRAAQHERATLARIHLGRIADAHCCGRLEAVGIGLGGVAENGSANIALHRICDAREVGALVWPRLTAEDVADCLLALTTLLAGFGVFPLSSEGDVQDVLLRPAGVPLH